MIIDSDTALIHGPPGTGKTQTLLEIIRQLVLQTPPKRVLVCGPSNISVDNIALRLPPDLSIVRLGHPARLLPRVLARSLDVLTQTSGAGEIVKDVRQELDSMIAKLAIGGKNRIRGKERKEGWDQVRHLRGEFRFREGKATRDLVASSKVYCPWQPSWILLMMRSLGGVVDAPWCGRVPAPWGEV